MTTQPIRPRPHSSSFPSPFPFPSHSPSIILTCSCGNVPARAVQAFRLAFHLTPPPPERRLVGSQALKSPLVTDHPSSPLAQFITEQVRGRGRYQFAISTPNDQDITAVYELPSGERIR